jgi:uncharacterized protein YecE (DUF72 family)
VASPFARSRYFQEYRTVELQNTFYQLPDITYAQRLRREAPESFIFNMKAWQVITHPPTSPTWKRMKTKPPGELRNYGYLQPTRENLDAWSKVVEVADALEAVFIVLQTPPSFGYSENNYNNAKKFFGGIERRGHCIGWEPRGSWRQHRDRVREIVCSTRVVHVVDPLRWEPVLCEWQKRLYFRLHGVGGREVNYRYRYTEDDFKKLLDIIDKYSNVIEEVYVMFNNIYMADDSKRFREYARKQGYNVE